MPHPKATTNQIIDCAALLQTVLLVETIPGGPGVKDEPVCEYRTDIPIADQPACDQSVANKLNMTKTQVARVRKERFGNFRRRPTAARQRHGERISDLERKVADLSVLCERLVQEQSRQRVELEQANAHKERRLAAIGN